LALLFGCCHRSLSTEAQVALTLRAVAGLSTVQIARAFLVPPATMAARIVRAKRKIAAAGIPFSLPASDELAERLSPVLSVIYLVYTEGHASGSAEMLLRGDLCDEALWLAGTLSELLPDEPEVLGLAALLYLTDARRTARVDDSGLPVLIEDQDRSRWDQERLTAGLALLARARRAAGPGPYALQAEIAAQHGLAACWDDTDWDAIVRCYDRLLAINGTPVVALNRAVAVAMRDGPSAGLPLVEELLSDPSLSRYHYLYAARADLLRRLGRNREAVSAYRQAISHCTNDAERRFLSSRVNLLDGVA
jgi:RNA polymerase sigma-70 factor (ECF subfamily)